MEIIFERVGEVVAVKIFGDNVYFSNADFGFKSAYTIEALKLNPAGILKEFPDLEGKSDIEMQTEAKKRFREHIKSLPTIKEKAQYIIKEFTNMGYQTKYIKQEGFRTKNGI